MIKVLDALKMSFNSHRAWTATPPPPPTPSVLLKASKGAALKARLRKQLLVLQRSWLSDAIGRAVVCDLGIEMFLNVSHNLLLLQAEGKTTITRSIWVFCWDDTTLSDRPTVPISSSVMRKIKLINLLGKHSSKTRRLTMPRSIHLLPALSRSEYIKARLWDETTITLLVWAGLLFKHAWWVPISGGV